MFQHFDAFFIFHFIIGNLLINDNIFKYLQMTYV